MSQTGLKTNYTVCGRHEAFFTGGRVQVSRDGDYMFCGCGNLVQIMNVSDGRLFQSIGKDEESEISSFIVSPDDQHLIVANRQLLLIQYDWRNNVTTRKWRAIHTTQVNCMAFDVSSTLLATGGSDHTIKVWDIVKQYCTHNLKGHTGVVSTLIFHPNLDLLQLFSAADDYQIRQWDLRRSECLHVFSGHYSSISCLELTADAVTLVSAGRDSVVLCWNLDDKTKKTIPVYESVESLLLLKTNEAYPQFNLSASDDLHVITAGEKGILKVWNTRTGHCLFTRTITAQGRRNDVTTDPDKEVDTSANHISQTMFVPALEAFCVVTYQHNIILYKLDDMTIQKQFAGYNDDILDIKLFGRNDSRLAVATNTEQLKIFDVETWHCDIVHGHSDIVMSLDVYKNGHIMVTGSKDRSIRIWKVTDDDVTCLAVGTGHSKAVNTVSLSRSRPDFCVSAGEDNTLKLWQMADALEAATTDDGEPRRISAHLTERVHEKDVNSVDVSPNDRFVVTGSQDRTAKLWKSEDLTLLGVFRGHKRGIWSVAFSPVDQAIATASADCMIKIWSITDFSCIRTFEGHESSVLKVIFVTRGMQIVSTGSDGLLKLWTLKTNECVKTFDEHTEKIWALCASSDDSRIVTGGADSNLLVWKDVTAEESQQERAKSEQFVVKEQKLSNLLQQKKYVKAIGLTITLEQPFRLLNILQRVLALENGEDELETVIGKLRPDQLGSVLRFAVDWNTNSKYSYEAQIILNIVLKAYTPDQILELPNVKSIVEGFLPYTERHFQRLSRLKQQTCFVDYTLRCMKMISSPGPSSMYSTTEDFMSSVAVPPVGSFLLDTSGHLGPRQAAENADGAKRTKAGDDVNTETDDVTMGNDARADDVNDMREKIDDITMNDDDDDADDEEDDDDDDDDDGNNAGTDDVTMDDGVDDDVKSYVNESENDDAFETTSDALLNTSKMTKPYVGDRRRIKVG